MSSHLHYLNFDLLFLPGDSRSRYRARVSHAPGGEGQCIFEVPFGDDKLENFLLKLGQPRRGIRKLDSPQTKLAKQFGSELFQALFHGELLVSYRSSVDEAEHQKRGLRLRIHTNETPELAKLPWEYLYNSPLNQFMALGRKTPVIRYLELQSLIPSLRVKPPLRILVVVSSPNGVAQLNSKDEWDRLNAEMSPLIKAGRVALEPLESATLGGLQRRLQGEEIHILHFIGHGGFDAASKDGLLLFEDENRNQRLVSGEKLGVLLHNHSSLRLAVVNACDGARSSDDDPFAGVAQSLVQQGLPAVIAMQFEISDKAARVFASGFYGALANGYPVDAALVEARTAIHSEELGAEWGTPVLFMRAPDGRLFDIEPQERLSNTQQSAEKESTQGRDSLQETRKLTTHSGAERRMSLFELLALGLSAGLVLAGLLFVAYKNQFVWAWTATTLRRANSSFLSFFSLSLVLLGVAAYVFWRKRLWVTTLLSKTARNYSLAAILAGCLGYSIAHIYEAENSFKLIMNIADANSGKPLNASEVTVLAEDSRFSGFTGPDGNFRMALPPGVSTLELRATVAHAGYNPVLLSGFQYSSGVLNQVALRPIAPLQTTGPTLATFKATFEFTQLPIINLSIPDSLHFNYGFSSLERDKDVKGDGVRIKQIRVALKVRVHSEHACCDVWILLGPGPFQFKAGAVTSSVDPFSINPSPAVAPVQARFVIGNGGKPIAKETVVPFYATYDFDSKQWSGDIDNHNKEFFASPLDLSDGLYAQVFLWNGNPAVNVDVGSLSLMVEGTKPTSK